jgi:hypothetical protein
MSIKLLALDLDGTVFSDDLVISERTRRSIRAAQEKGVVVTIATGRMIRSARIIAAVLGIEQPLICYQGAMLAHSRTAELLYHRTIPREHTLEIIKDARSRQLHLNLYLNDEIYVERITPEAEFYSRINMDMPINAVGDLDTWLSKQGGLEPTKLVIVTNEEQTDATLSLFTNLYSDRMQVTKSHPRFTEFTNIECSKGRALAFLAAHLSLTRDEVMAIGDGHNDLDMIAWAGYGVAMGTSPQAVLEAARIVTGSLADEGAARVIEQHILGAIT